MLVTKITLGYRQHISNFLNANVKWWAMIFDVKTFPPVQLQKKIYLCIALTHRVSVTVFAAGFLEFK